MIRPRKIRVRGRVTVTQTVPRLTDEGDVASRPAGHKGVGSTRSYTITAGYTRTRPASWVDPKTGKTQAEAAILLEFVATVPVARPGEFSVEVSEVLEV